MTIDTDRNLLFGIVALQLDFVRRDQLIEIMNAWAISKDRSLAEHLETSGAITSECRTLLDSLVKEHVKKHGGSVSASLAAMPETRSLHAELSRISDPQIHQSLRTFSMAAANVDPYATEKPQAIQTTTLRFKVLRPHAQGGLGVVSVARDQELNREVALKEIQSTYADDESARARFVLEAEVTGGLEHPNIVPVYGLGYYADGRPYYAMRFIKGNSLKEVVDRFHSSNAKSNPGASSRMVELRNLLGRFVDVCQAIDYAHSRGVIHRDLKPGNIMLGEYGETLVVDWGLAKTGGSSNSELLLSSEPALKPPSVQSVEPTQMGSTIGTLQFMSPEQAAGRNDLMGPAADIYSLGATLYYILTGKPSVTGSNMSELLRAVRAGEFIRPSVVVRDIPKALESICLKAMSLEPRDRYPSAQAMARDLECWLADEPVSSLTESNSERFARWLRRHRTWFRAVSTAVLAVIAVLVTAVVLVNQQRTVAIQQRTLAEGLASEKSDLAVKEIELRKKAEWQSASRSIEQSVSLAQHVDSVNGVPSLVRDLDEVQRIHADDLENTLRNQLGRWGGALHTLESAVRHSGSIRTLAQSPDGTLMLIGTNETASCMDLASGQTVGKPLSHTDLVTDALFRRSGDVLVTGSLDMSVCFWNARTGELIGTPLIHEEPVTAIALSGDERYLAIASGTKIRLWEVDSHQATDIEFDQKAVINELAFSPTEPVLLAGDQTGKIKVWNTETKERIGRDWKIDYPIMSMAVSPDGKMAATCDFGNVVRLWFIATGDSAGAGLNHFGLVTHASFSLDGTQLLTSSADQMVRLWDVASRALIGPPLRHPSVVNRAIFDRDGKTVWTGCSDRGLRHWKLANGKSVPLELGQNGNVIAANFNQENTAVRMVGGAIRAGDLTIPADLRRWNVPSGSPLGIPTPSRQWQDVAAFSHSGNFFAAATMENKVQIFRVADGEPSGAPMQMADAIKAIAFSHNDAMLLVGTKKGQVQVWRVESGEPVRTPIPLESQISSVAFFPDDQRFIVGSWDSHAHIYSLSDPSEQGHVGLKQEGLIVSVGVHPDGKMFFTCLGDGSLRLWDASSFLQIGSAMKITPKPQVAMFSSDGRSLWAGCQDGSIRQWDVRSRAEIGPALRHSKTVYAMAMSPNGQQIATASGDWTARLWDTGPELGSYEQIRSRYELLTGCTLESDGTIKILSMDEWDSRSKEGNSK